MSRSAKSLPPKKLPVWLELFGWYGPVAIIVAFALVSFDIVTARSYTFQLLNATGAASLAFISIIKHAYQPAALNIFIFLISVFAILQMVLWL